MRSRLLVALAIGVGLSSEAAPQRPTAAHFHHVHLNVASREKTIAFYEKFFGAVEVSYRGKAPALFTERSFILLDTVDRAPATNDGTSLWHIGWAGVDGASEFNWRVDAGITVQSPISRPKLAGVENTVDVMYFSGPDKELIEVATGSRNHRFEHVHLLSSDVAATVAWFEKHLGLVADHPKPIDFHGVVLATIHVDNVNIVIFGRQKPDIDSPIAERELWPDGGFQSTSGRAIDHLAFSYAALAPVFARMKAGGVEVVDGLATDPRLGHKRFTVRGPDKLTIELVEDKPLPEGLWSR